MCIIFIEFIIEMCVLVESFIGIRVCDFEIKVVVI